MAAAGEPEPPARAEPPRRPARVLVVEDHADTAAVYAMFLSGLGCRVECAPTPADAERLCGAAPAFDLMIVDIGLPGEDGWSVVPKLLATCPGAKAVAVSGYAGADAERRSRAAGFAAHLLKPVDLETLEAVLADVVHAPGGDGTP